MLLLLALPSFRRLSGRLGTVYSHGHAREALTGEYHNSYIVVLAAADEFAGDSFGRFETVGLEVAGEHARRDVHRYHDVGAFGACGAPVVLELRACEHYDEAPHRSHSEHKQEMAHPLLPRHRQFGKRRCGGECHVGACVALLENVPYYHRHVQHKEPEVLRMS